MPTRDQLIDALRQADQAGDTEGAHRIAAMIRATPAQAPRKGIEDRYQAPQPKPHGLLDTLTSSLSRGASAGADRYIAAAVEAPLTYGIRKLRGEHPSLSGEFHRAIDQDRAQQTADQSAHPRLAGGADLAGMIGSPLNVVGAGSGNALARFAAPALAYGGVSGATETRGGLADRAIGAIEGAGGALIGQTLGLGAGRLIGRLAPRFKEEGGALLNWITSKEAKGEHVDRVAMRRVLQRVHADASGLGPTAQDMVDLRKAMPAKKPVTLMDVGGENVRAYAGRISRAPGEGRNTLAKFLNDRSKGTGERLQQDVAQHIHSGNAYESQQALMQARKAAAAPLYDEAYQHFAINPDHMQPSGAIGGLMTRPSFRSGMRNALRIAAEEGRDPNTLGIAFDAAGEPRFTKVPSWQTLDYVKRGMDDVVEKYRSDVTGKLNLDTYGRAADQTRTLFRSTLRELNPAYGKALDAYSGPSASMDAIRQGQRFESMRAEQIRDLLKDMPESEREFYKMGAADALQQKIARHGKLGGTQSIKDATVAKLRPLFRSKAAHDKFVDAVEAEYRMIATKADVIGNSATARRLAEDDSDHEMVEAGKVALHAAHGNFLRAFAKAGSALRNRAQSAKAQAIDAAAARLLTKPFKANALRQLMIEHAPVTGDNNLVRALEAAGRLEGAQSPVLVNRLIGTGQ